MKSSFRKSSGKVFSLLVLLGAMLVTTTAPLTSHAREGKMNNKINTRQVVFIHGMFMTPKCWSQWLQYFTDKGFEVSAPAWPYHDGAPEDLRQNPNQTELGNLTLQMVIEHYRSILNPMKSNPPILVGHSMGGLIAQILLSEGLGSAAIAIDSAPPQGVFSLSFSFLKSNWQVIKPWANTSSPVLLNEKQFHYAFTNKQTLEASSQAYTDQFVPESRHVGKAPLSNQARIDRSVSRGPLLIVAGGADHIIPASLNKANFQFYKQHEAQSGNITEFKLFENRDHWTIAAEGWEKVADYTLEWLASISE